MSIPSTPSSWRFWRLTLQGIFSLGVLGWLVYQLGAYDLALVFSRVTPGLVLACMVIYLLAQLLSVWRWRLISVTFGFGARGGYYTSLYFLGMFYNIFLPTGYGGDVVKVLYQATDRHPPSRGLAALTVFLDRFMGLLALLVIGAIASLSLPSMGLYGSIMGYGLALGLVLGGFGLRFFSTWRVLPRRLRLLALTLRAGGLRWVWLGLMSMVIQALNVLIYYLIFHSLGVTLSLPVVAFSFALVTIATLLPVSVGGLGVREGGWAALLLFFGSVPQAGVSAGVLYFVIQSLCSLLGLYPFLALRRSAAGV